MLGRRAVPPGDDLAPKPVARDKELPVCEQAADTVTITALRPRGAKGTSFTVEMSNGESLRLRAETVASRGLNVGDAIDATDIHAWQRDDSNRRALEAGLNFISYRPRSAKEVADHLRKKSFAEAARGHAVHRLRELGYLDDAAFARFWVESRETHRPKGQWALAWELRQKGIGDAIIEDVLARFGGDETALARMAARKRTPAMATADYDEFRRKLGTFLARRGFSYEVVEQVVDELWEEREAVD